MINAEKAQDMLWKASLAVEQNKPIQAMRMIGMKWSMLENMTMEEAAESFRVRVHDLMQIVKDNDND